MALVLITHDMGVVAETAQRVVVQYAGQQVERAARRAACSPTRIIPTPRPCSPRCPSARTGAPAALDPGRRARASSTGPRGCLFYAALRASPPSAAAPSRRRAAPTALGRALCHYPLVDGVPPQPSAREAAA